VSATAGFDAERSGRYYLPHAGVVNFSIGK